MIYRLKHDFSAYSVFTCFLKTMLDTFDIMGCYMGHAVWGLYFFFSLILGLEKAS